jgi:hypothetical protein
MHLIPKHVSPQTVRRHTQGGQSGDSCRFPIPPSPLEIRSLCCVRYPQRLAILIQDSCYVSPPSLRPFPRPHACLCGVNCRPRRSHGKVGEGPHTPNRPEKVTACHPKTLTPQGARTPQLGPAPAPRFLEKGLWEATLPKSRGNPAVLQSRHTPTTRPGVVDPPPVVGLWGAERTPTLPGGTPIGASGRSVAAADPWGMWGDGPHSLRQTF